MGKREERPGSGGKTDALVEVTQPRHVRLLLSFYVVISLFFVRHHFEAWGGRRVVLNADWMKQA